MLFNELFFWPAMSHNGTEVAVVKMCGPSQGNRVRKTMQDGYVHHNSNGVVDAP